MGGLSVSVIVPTHDRHDLLRRALDSIAAQTRAPLEVIVVDDGSKDGTAAMLVELVRLLARQAARDAMAKVSTFSESTADTTES